MSPLHSFIRWELKRVFANISRSHPEADELAVKLLITQTLQGLVLAEIQPEDERKRG